MKGLKGVLFILVLIAGGTLAGVFLLRSGDDIQSMSPATPSVIIEGAPPVHVEIADTPLLQQKGLSGHAALAADEGMLFLFNEEGNLGFWMKDMLFSLDIIWIGADWKIVDVSQNIAPKTYPQVFSPKTDAKYVLEVPAGFFESHNLSIGRSIQFKK